MLETLLVSFTLLIVLTKFGIPLVYWLNQCSRH